MEQNRRLLSHLSILNKLFYAFCCSLIVGQSVLSDSLKISDSLSEKAEQAYARGDIPSALYYYQQQLSISPNDSKAKRLNQIANLQLSLGQLKEASQSIQQALKHSQ